MVLARVTGTVVSTMKLEVLEGYKILIVQPLNDRLDPAGRSLLAIDTVQAGTGDTVLVLDEGNSARMILGDPAAPVRTVVVGVVDAVVKGN
ncbi:Ethanolamine utilization protein EutN [subsurface metagenome]